MESNKVSDTRVVITDTDGATWDDILAAADGLGIEPDHIHAVLLLDDGDTHIVHFGIEDSKVEVSSQTIWKNGDWEPGDFDSVSVDEWHAR